MLGKMQTCMGKKKVEEKTVLLIKGKNNGKVLLGRELKSRGHL